MRALAVVVLVASGACADIDYCDPLSMDGVYTMKHEPIEGSCRGVVLPMRVRAIALGFLSPSQGAFVQRSYRSEDECTICIEFYVRSGLDWYLNRTCVDIIDEFTLTGTTELTGPDCKATYRTTMKRVGQRDDRNSLARQRDISWSADPDLLLGHFENAPLLGSPPGVVLFANYPEPPSDVAGTTNGKLSTTLMVA